MSSSDDVSTDDAGALATDAAANLEETEPEVVDELRLGLVQRLTELVGDAVVEHHIIPETDLWIRVQRDAWAEVAQAVRITLGARYFGFISAIDWQPSPFGRSMDAEVDKVVHGFEAKEPLERTSGYAGGDTRFQVFARVANIKEHWGITLKADVDDEHPSIATWTKVYAGADWHEREAYEMFGIEFVGHPALRKIYLPGDFEGHPLRKDFPLLARMVKPWPGIVDVEPMPGGDDESDDEGGSAEGGESTAAADA